MDQQVAATSVGNQPNTFGIIRSQLIIDPHSSSNNLFLRLSILPGLRDVKKAAALLLILIAVSLQVPTLNAQSRQSKLTRLLPIGNGWARNQVNAVIFRRNSVTTHGRTQYAAFY